MDLKPVDFQVMVPKTTEISKIMKEQNQKDTSNKDTSLLGIKEQAEKDVKAVTSKQKTFKTVIKEKQEQNKNSGKQKETKKEDEEKEEPKKTISQDSKGSIIDIQI